MSASASSSSKRESTRLPPLTARSSAARRTIARPSSARLEAARLCHELLRRERLQPELAGDVGLRGARFHQHRGAVHAAHVRRELGHHAADVLRALDIGGGEPDHRGGVAAPPAHP